MLDEPDLAGTDSAAADAAMSSELGVATDLASTDLASTDLSTPRDLAAAPDLAGRTGETCATAVPLAFFSQEANADVDLNGRANDLSGSCGGLNEGDVVLTFTLPSAASTTITVSPPASGYIPPFYVYDSSSCDVINQISCKVGCANCSSSMVFISNLAAGTYYLVLDGTGGSFHVKVTY